MLFVPSFVFTLIFASPPVYPSCASVVLELDALISSPVRYPAFAVFVILSVCVPFGALEPAFTEAFVLSDTDVFFRLYAVENLRLDTLLYRLYTFLFKDFHASCVQPSFVWAFSYLDFLYE